MNNLLFFIFIFLFSFMQCQEILKVDYETISNPKISFAGSDNLSEDMKEEIKTKALQGAKKPKKFVLFYNQGNSFFYRNIQDENSYSEKQKIEYFRFSNKDGIYVLNDFIVDKFYGYYPMNNVNIEFANETQTIENYNCKLAIYKIGNTTSKVWYTEDIPISAGPYNYYKVPGLILKIESPSFLCYAVNISKVSDDKDIRNMDSDLKVYEGEELNSKIQIGLSQLRNHNQQKFESKKESFEKK